MKGNLLNHYRQIINDEAVTAFKKYVVNWDTFNPSHLSSTRNAITQEYDALNRIRKLTLPTDRASQRKVMEPMYNKGGALLSVKLGSSRYVEEIAYNARGQRILKVAGNGMMTRYAYNPETFRLARTRSEKYTKTASTFTPNGGVQQDLAYTYDLEGSILTQNDEAPANASAQGPGGLLRRFGHDPLRRLISAIGRESSNVYQQPSWDLNIRPHDFTATNTYTRSFSYDKLGNIQTLNHVADGHTNQNFNRIYNYGSPFTDNKLESFEVGSNTYDYQYDAAGNIVQEAANRYYEWTHNDKPATYSNQAGSANPTVYTNYFYNAQGERVKKLTRKDKRIEVTFYMDGGLFETSYVKPVGTSIDNNRFYNTLHVLDGSSRIATVRVGNDVDDPTPSVKYFLEDHLMDSLVALTTSGSLINREEFYPFGETSFGGFAKKRYRFNGKEKDEESGLYYYGQRYYAPWLCRFISVDPVATSYMHLSPYNYAGNKPINSPDIDGLQGTDESVTDVNGSQSLQGVNDSGTELNHAGTNYIAVGDNFSQTTVSTTAHVLPNGKIGIHQIKQEVAGSGDMVYAYKTSYRSFEGNLSEVQAELPEIDFSGLNASDNIEIPNGEFGKTSGIPNGNWQVQDEFDASKDGGPISWDTYLDRTQTALDAIGLIPGFGEVADIANGIISLGRGDYWGAALSFASAVPFFGYFASGLKWGSKVTEGVYDVSTTAGNYVGQSKNVFKRISDHFGGKGSKSLKGQSLVDGTTHLMEGSTKLERELYEQYIILNKYRGKENLLNKVNPVGGRYDLNSVAGRELFDKDVMKVIEKFNLTKY